MCAIALVQRHERIKHRFVFTGGEYPSLDTDFFHRIGKTESSINDDAYRSYQARLVCINLVRSGNDVIATGGADIAALLLIGAIILTGNAMRFGAHFNLAETREYFAALATFSDVMEMELLANNVFMLHMCLGFLLLMLIPFSKILHFGGIFFTHQLIRKQ